MSNVIKPLVLFVCLVGGGFMVGILSVYAGSALLADDYAGWGGLVGAIAGMMVGYPLGIIIVLAMARFVVKYRGSFVAAAAGVITASALIAGLTQPLGLNEKPNLFLGLYFGLSPILGVAGYQLKCCWWRRRADSNR